MLIAVAVGILVAYGFPTYLVWQQNKVGEAELARAEQNRQIAIQEAKAKEESAKSLANAEIIRAQGIAEANKIIGDSLKNNDAYIHYLRRCAKQQMPLFTCRPKPEFRLPNQPVSSKRSD